jgi:hypothetical protein
MRVTDGEVDPHVAPRSDLAFERVPSEVVGEARGNPSADVLGFSIPYGAGAGELGPGVAFYLQLGLVSWPGLIP